MLWGIQTKLIKWLGAGFVFVSALFASYFKGRKAEQNKQTKEQLDGLAQDVKDSKDVKRQIDNSGHTAADVDRELRKQDASWD